MVDSFLRRPLVRRLGAALYAPARGLMRQRGICSSKPHARRDGAARNCLPTTGRLLWKGSAAQALSPRAAKRRAGNGRIPHRGGNPAGPRADAVRDKGCPHAPDSAAPESGRIAGRGPVGELLRLEAGRGVLSSDKPLEVSIWRSQQVSAGADAVLPEMLDSSFQAMTRRRYMRPWRFSMAAVTEPLGSLRLTNSTPAAREARSYGTCLTRENSAKSRVQPSASAPSPTGSAAPDRAGRRW